jgi:hypothetical protein
MKMLVASSQKGIREYWIGNPLSTYAYIFPPLEQTLGGQSRWPLANIPRWRLACHYVSIERQAA